jgi:hypothetical protein
MKPKIPTGANNNHNAHENEPKHTALIRAFNLWISGLLTGEYAIEVVARFSHGHISLGVDAAAIELIVLLWLMCTAFNMTRWGVRLMRLTAIAVIIDMFIVASTLPHMYSLPHYVSQIIIGSYLLIESCFIQWKLNDW